MRKHNPKDNGVQLPWNDLDFINAWQEWLAYRTERKLAKYVPRGLKCTFTKLFNDSEGDPKKAVEMIFHAMSKNWQGLYPIKTLNNGNQKANTEAHASTINDLKSKLAQFDPARR